MGVVVAIVVSPSNSTSASAGAEIITGSDAYINMIYSVTWDMEKGRGYVFAYVLLKIR